MIRATSAPDHAGGPGAVTWTSLEAALGEDLDHRREARHPDLEARIEGDLDLGTAGSLRSTRRSVPITSTS